MHQADLEPLCRELFVRGLEFIVALLVCLGINFACASTAGAIQLYPNAVDKTNANYEKLLKYADALGPGEPHLSGKQGLSVWFTNDHKTLILLPQLCPLMPMNLLIMFSIISN